MSSDRLPLRLKVGPLWFVNAGEQSEMIEYSVPLREAVPYGDKLTAEMGHATYWENLSKLGAAGLRSRKISSAPLWSEYDEWPRGRVVFDTTSDKSLIFCDAKLHGIAFIRRILSQFNLDERPFEVLADSHYRSPRHVKPPASD